MTVADYLIDTSALARVLLRQNTADWDDRIGAGLVAICDLTELEVLYSARSAPDRTRLKATFDAHYAWCPMPDGVYRRSRVVQEQLTAKGEHRSTGSVDLLVAAAAEEAGLTLLHFDRDFETIARTTGQPVRMIDLRH
ncbi:PIN domain nuclease [Streptomyces ureilyticus]|uniref:Ribonuclease VapC n=1 Tax=Streptomyces ureilyticus TaxID=1775131 RepID=A0ABX0DMJ4_9ACTN|nr:PIN domain nuclease [Streptomyces ureilyticus]NGO43008.1 PIN domain nuclease [Streptomyces ureilyticus]